MEAGGGGLGRGPVPLVEAGADPDPIEVDGGPPEVSTSVVEAVDVVCVNRVEYGLSCW